MYRLTLQWAEGGQIRTVNISSEDKTKFPGSIRIGRDEQQCDLVLSQTETTVSRLHVEIFSAAANTLCLRNLTRNNPPEKRNPAIVDGQNIIDQEVPIRVGSVIQLGKISLKVKAIEGPLFGPKPSQSKPLYILRCTNLKTPHELSLEYEGGNCPYCGHLVLNPTIIF
ncbi:FHA domain-containing protein [Kamptonema formosum]|uniref:FHA domain-containing protein n=1 Tax=Kamptonema formosum TaxID=331992 RepID=UPI00037877DF|nr:FHA domain-containing protein [Oscillatoria sp. PCC 10802]